PTMRGLVVPLENSIAGWIVTNRQAVRIDDAHKDKRAAIAHAWGHSGLAVAMTSFTTAAGLLSFSTAEVAPIGDLGIFAGGGVILSLLYTLILLPALLSILPVKAKTDDKAQNRTQLMDNILLGIASLSVNHSRKILVVSAVLFVVAVGGVAQTTFKHDPLKWLPEEWDVRKATELLDVEMKGTGVLEVVVNTGKENGLYEPRIMNALNTLHSRIDAIKQDDIFVGKTISVVDILKESNRALHQNKESSYTVPADRELIAQELLLFENSGSDDLEDFVDSQFSMARFTVKTPWVDAASNARFIKTLEQEFGNAFNQGESFYVTGMGSLFSRVMDASIESTKKSYVIAGVVICIMMIMMLGSTKLGLVSMIPNLLPILISMGFMGYFHMPLDQFSMLIGSISVGLVVDDTIHFMHNFRRYHLKFNDVNRAIQETLLSTGRAILVTTVVLCLGFFIFTAASMENLIRFGLVTGITIILALLCDLLLAPALMKVMYEGKNPDGGKSELAKETL
ncbi:MAG: efflux RND transporter permease subunit, partial [Gammaproteobacteria bacterium]|nr:efflux RND transporter permease subunit [Gammaproteobacteria bacterium]